MTEVFVEQPRLLTTCIATVFQRNCQTSLQNFLKFSLPWKQYVGCPLSTSHILTKKICSEFMRNIHNGRKKRVFLWDPIFLWIGMFIDILLKGHYSWPTVNIQLLSPNIRISNVPPVFRAHLLTARPEEIQQTTMRAVGLPGDSQADSMALIVVCRISEGQP